MRGRIVKIGNSQGIRIPKPLLVQSGITGDVDIEIESNKITIRPISKPRDGWDEAFQKMAEDGEDKLLDGEQPIAHSWDETEWQW